MPQSLADVLIHLVFSTKNRRPFLRHAADRDVLTGYFIGILRNLQCPSLSVGVVEDHVHVLFSLQRTVTIADVVEELKTASSKRIKEEGASLRDFYWQNGCGAFSVSQLHKEQVIAYIANQEEHHRQRTFQEEYRLMLERHQIEWDERYVWD